jgi:chromosome segregation ATPase
VIIAMATSKTLLIFLILVGFGDFVPKTHLGRFTIILSCFWGVFLVSLIVSNLTISSSFVNKEAKAYDILYRLNLKATLKQKAAKLVTLTTELVSIQKKLSKKKITPKIYLEKKIRIRQKISQSLEEFRLAKNKIPDFEIGVDELLRQLTEKLSKDIDEITNYLSYISTLSSNAQTQLSTLQTNTTSNTNNISTLTTQVNSLNTNTNGITYNASKSNFSNI